MCVESVCIHDMCYIHIMCAWELEGVGESVGVNGEAVQGDL